jgi:MFS family permease
MYFGCIVPAYGYAYFAPTIIRGLGFSPISAQLHSVPPWIAAFGLGMACAYASDRTRHRAAFGIVPAALGLSGFAVLLAHPASVRVRYGALFLCATGVYTAMPLFIGWYSCNLSGHLRRGVGIAFQIGFGNIGGIFASYAFPATDGPRYTMGYALCIAFLIVAMGAAAAYYVACAAQNKARERRQAAGERDDHLSPEERAVRGDMRVGYRYML